MPSYTYKDGNLVAVPDTVIAESCELRGAVNNTLIIRPGAHVTALATISGTVLVEKDAVLVAHGPVGGTVNVHRGGSAVFHDRLGGTIHVARGGAATLAATAVALGTMKIDGLLTNEGVRGVQISGAGNVIDTPGATVRQPDETWADGTVVYRN